MARRANSPPAPVRQFTLRVEASRDADGDSGTGKGMVAAWHVARATQREERVLGLDFEGHRKEWERRLGWWRGCVSCSVGHEAFTPYCERDCLRSETPEASRVPRTTL